MLSSPSSTAPLDAPQGPSGQAEIEHEVVHDLLRRALPVAPVMLGVAALAWGVDGVTSAAYGLMLVLTNFWISAALLAWGARISPIALASIALVGYLVRLGLITIAVLAVRNQPWIDLVALGLTIIVTHLGLLIWEARRVSASLAFPGLKPSILQPNLAKEDRSS
jgi:hypothetical protein